VLVHTFGRSRFRRFAATTAVTAAVLVVLAGTGRAQDAGTIAALAGTVEIGRGGTWTAATVGAAVQAGDSLRTGRPGRLQFVFRDDTVCSLADETELVINEQVFEPDRGALRSLIHLARGKVKALVSEYYSRHGASYQIETVTAVAGVRGTEFVIVFDPVAEVTSVVGVTGTTEVHSVLDRVRHGVFVTTMDLPGCRPLPTPTRPSGRDPGDDHGTASKPLGGPPPASCTAPGITTVARGQFPTPPVPLDETTFRQYLDGLEFIDSPEDSLAAAQAVLRGAGVAPSEGAAASAAPPAALVAAPMYGGRSLESRQADAIDQPPAVLQQIQDNQGELGVRY